MKLYPIKTVPAMKEIIWGGHKLKDSYHKSADFDKLAESWELTVRPDGMNVIANGEYVGMTLGEYLDRLPEAIGADCHGDRFPLLIKFIDACDRLSIQVHPSDSYALANENEYGKTEMWYIAEAEEGAELVFGLNSDYTPERFDTAVREGKVEELLNRVKVKKGEVYFIPSGLVHAIGAGILICEIQQNSNVTYRVYDYNRLGKDGKPRELHVEKAKKVIVNYTPDEIEKLRFVTPDDSGIGGELLASCDKFKVHRFSVCGSQEINVTKDSFVSLTVTEGNGILVCQGISYPFEKGDSYFLPANLGLIEMIAENAVVMAASL